MKKKNVFLKHRIARTLNFLFLIPFILGFRPLLLRFSRTDLILYAVGVIIIIVMIVTSNHLPYVTLEGDRLILNLHYYQKPEVHFLERITLIEYMNTHSLKIHSRDFKPVRIHMNPGDVKKLLKLLEERNIKIQ